MWCGNAVASVQVLHTPAFSDVGTISSCDISGSTASSPDPDEWTLRSRDGLSIRLKDDNDGQSVVHQLCNLCSCW
jgi:hypothetical protein